MPYIDHISFMDLKELNDLIKKAGHQGKNVSNFTQPLSLNLINLTHKELNRLAQLAGSVGLSIRHNGSRGPSVGQPTAPAKPQPSSHQCHGGGCGGGSGNGCSGSGGCHQPGDKTPSEDDLRRKHGISVIGREAAILHFNQKATDITGNPDYINNPFPLDILSVFKDNAILVWLPEISVSQMMTIHGRLVNIIGNGFRPDDWEEFPMRAGWHLLVTEPINTINGRTEYTFNGLNSLIPPNSWIITEMRLAVYAMCAFRLMTGSRLFEDTWALCRNHMRSPHTSLVFRVACVFDKVKDQIFVDYAEVDDDLSEHNINFGLALEIPHK